VAALVVVMSHSSRHDTKYENDEADAHNYIYEQAIAEHKIPHKHEENPTDLTTFTLEKDQERLKGRDSLDPYGRLYPEGSYCVAWVLC
jgi:hypothetical protein